MPSATGSAITCPGTASIRSRATDQRVRMCFTNWLIFTLPEQTEIVTRDVRAIGSNCGLFLPLGVDGPALSVVNRSSNRRYIVAVGWLVLLGAEAAEATVLCICT